MTAAETLADLATDDIQARTFRVPGGGILAAAEPVLTDADKLDQLRRLLDGILTVDLHPDRVAETDPDGLIADVRADLRTALHIIDSG